MNNSQTHEEQSRRQPPSGAKPERSLFDRAQRRTKTEPKPEAGQRDDDGTAESRMESEGGPPLPAQPAEAEPVSNRAAQRLSVGDVMTRQVRSVLGDTPIKEVALLMAGEGIGAMPVVLAEGRLLGMVTDRDIVIRACAGDKSIDDLRASDAMTPDPSGITADKTVSAALATMAQLQVHRLPVVDDQSRLIGIISTADVARHSDSSAELREALAEISNRQAFWSRIWR